MSGFEFFSAYLGHKIIKRDYIYKDSSKLFNYFKIVKETKDLNICIPSHIHHLFFPDEVSSETLLGFIITI